LAVFWKRTTRKAVNFTLSIGSAMSLGIGVVYLWVFPAKEYPVWPHYMLLSFLIFAMLFMIAVIISLLDRQPITAHIIDKSTIAEPTKLVWKVWAALIIVMVCLYIFFNGF
jgi:solute:Na+ symporter, SSS family